MGIKRRNTIHFTEKRGTNSLRIKASSTTCNVQSNPMVNPPSKLVCITTGIDHKSGLIRASDLQQNLQQTCTFRLRSCFGCASASFISSYLTSINHFHTNTYKPPFRTVDLKVAGSSPAGRGSKAFGPQQMYVSQQTCRF